MHIPKLSSRTVLLIGLVVGFMGCSGQRSPASHAPPQTSSESSKPLKTALSEEWFPSPVPAQHRYMIRDSSQIAINNDSTRFSAIETETIYSIATTQLGDSLGFQASADSITTTSHTPLLRTLLIVNREDKFDGIFTKNGSISALVSRRPALCAGGINPVATRIFELTNSFPKNPARVGDGWSDTASTTTCRGKTPLLQQIIRHYQIIDIIAEPDNVVLKIRRIVSTQFSGVSADVINHLSITGSGSGSAIIYLAQKTGALVKSDGVSQTLLTIVTSRGSFPFNQNLTTHITSQ